MDSGVTKVACLPVNGATIPWNEVAAWALLEKGPGGHPAPRRGRLRWVGAGGKPSLPAPGRGHARLERGECWAEPLATGCAWPPGRCLQPAPPPMPPGLLWPLPVPQVGAPRPTQLLDGDQGSEVGSGQVAGQLSGEHKAGTAQPADTGDQGSSEERHAGQPTRGTPRLPAECGAPCCSLGHGPWETESENSPRARRHPASPAAPGSLRCAASNACVSPSSRPLHGGLGWGSPIWLDVFSSPSPSPK